MIFELTPKGQDTHKDVNKFCNASFIIQFLASPCDNAQHRNGFMDHKIVWNNDFMISLRNFSKK